MTPLTQQLEDKKKGCGCEFIDGKNVYNCGERWYTHHIKGDVYDCLPNYCPKCKYEIAILEQAIAEIKLWKEEVERIRAINRTYFEDVKYLKEQLKSQPSIQESDHALAESEIGETLIESASSQEDIKAPSSVSGADTQIQNEINKDYAKEGTEVKDVK